MIYTCEYANETVKLVCKKLTNKFYMKDGFKTMPLCDHHAFYVCGVYADYEVTEEEYLTAKVLEA